MFELNEDMSIYLTRGDVASFLVTAKDENNNDYTFKVGDVVRFKVVGRKDYETVYLEKDFAVDTETTAVTVYLTSQDTKIGEVISKPTDYWYEVELNPNTNPQTIIGYDQDGAKVFKLFPEGGETEEVTKPEDVPVVDDELSYTSERPIQNQVVARSLSNLQTTIDEMAETAEKVEAFAEEKEAMQEEIADMADTLTGKESTTSFSGNTITTTYADGKSEVITEQADGSIVTKYYEDNVLYKTKTTTFNADGSISEVIS
jgi:hypothetical protein